MTQTIRSRDVTIDLLRVLGIFCVMLIHTPVVVDVEKAPFIYLLREIFTRGAVPAFFILSGYLAARKMKDRTVSFGHFSKDKLNTLIIPYLFWNGLVIVAVFVMKNADLGSSMAQSGAYLNLEPTFSSISKAWLGIDRSPIVYQFWFLRDLILAMFISFFVIRYVPPIPFLSLILLLIPNPLVASLGFFLLGCQLQGLVSLDRQPARRSCYLYCLAWGLASVAFMFGYVDLPFPFRQLGSALFLYFIAVILSSWQPAARLAALGPAVFFIYATHEPLQTVLGRLWEKFKIPGFEIGRAHV